MGARNITIIILSLLLIVTVIQARSSNCCNSYSNCCAACHHEPNCCSNCCQQTGCCSSESSSNCCQQRCTTPASPCPTPTPPEPCPSTPAPPVVTPSPPKPPSESISSVNNTQSVSTNLRVDSAITNTNKIYIPISVSNVNTNHLNSASRSHVVTQPPDTETLPPLISTTAKYPYRPILIPIPQPFPVPVPYPLRQNQTENCCTVVQPCREMYCNPYKTMCSDQCTDSVMYYPQNPCQDYGCSKRKYWSRKSCQSTAQYPFVSCGYHHQDCSYCGQDFYENFHTYQQCYGCFY